MKQFTREYVLNGITEADFQSWKHHPVTKVFMRYLRDYERQLAERQIAVLRTTDTMPDAFKMGHFNGWIAVVSEVVELSYQNIADFYPAEPEDQQQTEA